MGKQKPEEAKPTDSTKKGEKPEPAKDENPGKAPDPDPGNKDTGDTNKDKNPINSPDDISAKEIFDRMARISDETKNKYSALVDAKVRLVFIEEAHAGVQDLVKPQKRLDRRLGAPKKIEDSDERNLRITQKGSLGVDVRLAREKVDLLQEEFNRLCGGEKTAFKYMTLQINADSNNYVRKNKSFLLNKAKKLLEASLLAHGAMLLELRRKAKDDSEEGISLFNSSLRELLYIVDKEGAITCSGTASKAKIYPAVRKALKEWNGRSRTIPDLVWPPDKNQAQ
ncbi:hypothetical protein [Clostridium sp.]|uniref:hypothetical protein n=1 Tax=Clostridium sp. TaxID=1506 RepID=UPI00284911F3|nr:hypothetical protein [Clostridium sp.]MDR3596532.1 hypothetical protein [Clostridium sp.]